MTAEMIERYSQRIADPKERAVAEVLATLAELIKHQTEIDPLGGIPSGHIYAQICGRMSLDNFNAMIEALVQLKVIENRNHLLCYIGR